MNGGEGEPNSIWYSDSYCSYHFNSHGMEEMVRVIKLLLLWRKRALEYRNQAEKAQFESYNIQRKLDQCYKRYDHLLKHNVYLANENDNLHAIIKI